MQCYAHGGSKAAVVQTQDLLRATQLQLINHLWSQEVKILCFFAQNVCSVAQMSENIIAHTHGISQQAKIKNAGFLDSFCVLPNSVNKNLIPPPPKTLQMNTQKGFDNL